jgi:hypothetical protein
MMVALIWWGVDMRLPFAAVLPIVFVLLPPFASAATAACTAVSTASDLKAVRLSLAGNFCLVNDIDLAGIEMTPIGGAKTPFTGRFDGGGHVIRNLTIVSKRSAVGMFGVIAGGSVRNLTLAGVSLTGGKKTLYAGGVAGFLFGDGSIKNARVTGTINCDSTCRAGGIVGETDDATSLLRVSSAASIQAGSGGAAGGVAGQIAGQVMRSYAAGQVRCRSNCAVGGLVGWVKDDSGSIKQSFASGPVHGNNDGMAGGLVGYQGGTVTQSYATGRVVVGVSSAAAFAGAHGGPVNQVFGAGRVRGLDGSTLGGLSALLEEDATAIGAFWDLATTNQSFSVRGVGKTTTALQAALPPRYGPIWGITAGFSYPYLNLLDKGMFASTLASVVYNGMVYTFAPLGQLETTEYVNLPEHADAASLAAVYTMVARGIGLTTLDTTIATTKIDEFFWDDATQTATWTGPVTAYAQLGSVTDISGSQSIDDTNVIGQLKARNLVIIRGTDASAATHWMLATLFTSDEQGTVTALVADDPWTGTQVRIDPTTKQVVFPPDFPLSGFTVDGYQTVTLITPPARSAKAN